MEDLPNSSLRQSPGRRRKRSVSPGPLVRCRSVPLTFLVFISGDSFFLPLPHICHKKQQQTPRAGPPGPGTELVSKLQKVCGVTLESFPSFSLRSGAHFCHGIHRLHLSGKSWNHCPPGACCMPSFLVGDFVHPSMGLCLLKARYPHFTDAWILVLFVAPLTPLNRGFQSLDVFFTSEVATTSRSCIGGLSSVAGSTIGGRRGLGDTAGKGRRRFFNIS